MHKPPKLAHMTKSILFISRVFPPDSGASALRLLELAQGLAQHGWQVTVLTNKGRNIAPTGMHENIKLVRLPFGSVDRKPNTLQYILWLFALWGRALFLPAHDVTISLSEPPMSAIVTACLKPFKRTRIIRWIHDLYPQMFAATGRDKPILQPFLMWLSRWALNRHERIVTMGPDMNAVLVENKVRADKLIAIPNWPDVQATLLDKNKPARHDSSNPFVLEGVFTVLYSGNFGLIHDFEPIIDAIKIIQHSPHAIRFIMAGDGRKFDEVRSRIDEMLLTNVHFIRAQPKEKFIDMLLAGDAHISTLVPEAVGLAAPSKINSALGLARPCLYLGPEQSFQAQLIKEYHAGFVINPVDTQAKFLLADAIIQLATDANLYAQMQENALRAARSIGFDKALEQFETILRPQA